MTEERTHILKKDTLSLNSESYPPVEGQKECFKARYVLAILGFLGFANVYAMRVNLSVAIVAMVNQSAIAKVNHSAHDVCPMPNTTTSHWTTEGEFEWDEYTQGIILGSFFYGYIFTQLPGGYYAGKYGGKMLYGIGILITSVFTLLTPLAARTSTVMLIVVRVIEGLGEGVTFPAMHAMLGKWCPPFERSILSTFVYAGSQFGTVISLPLSGYLCAYGFDNGWPSVFYVFGTMGIIWFIFWLIYGFDSPEDHPRISSEEKLYIEASLGTVGSPVTGRAIPWKAILSSGPVWVITVAHFGQNWGFYTLLTELPTFMSNILHFNIEQNSMTSALPYLAMCIFSVSSSFVADWLRVKNYLGTTATRKIFQSISQLVPAVLMVMAGYVGCNSVGTVLLLTFAVGFSGISTAGLISNQLDIGSNYAGILMGVSNTFGTIPGFLAPYVVGALTNGQQTLTQWRIVFFIAAAIYIVCTILYVTFTTGDEQEWNSFDDDTTYRLPRSRKRKE